MRARANRRMAGLSGLKAARRPPLPSRHTVQKVEHPDESRLTSSRYALGLLTPAQPSFCGWPQRGKRARPHTLAAYRPETIPSGCFRQAVERPRLILFLDLYRHANQFSDVASTNALHYPSSMILYGLATDIELQPNLLA